MQTLEDRILSLEPQIDLLHECLGLGLFEAITITSDGFFLGQAPGDCGFNYFLGVPSESALERTKGLYARLSEEHRAELTRRLRARGIPPESIGIPEPKN